MIIKKRLTFLLLFLLTLAFSSCGAPALETTPQVVTIYSTSAAEPWLTDAYACAASPVVLSRVDDPSAADISLRIGEPEILSVPAFQIDTEEILVLTHRQSPIQNLTLEQAQVLFAQGDPSVQVWVYAPEADVQQVFDQFVMKGRGVNPFARVAAAPQQMSDTLVNEPNTVGILPRRWKAGDVRDVYSTGPIPVLALTRAEPAGVIRELISCLQK